MPTVVPPRQDSARFILTLVIIFFLYISPDSPSSSNQSSRELNVNHVSQSKNLLKILNSTHWQDFNPRDTSSKLSKPVKYLNLTGFRESDGYRGWQRFGAWKERSALFLQEAHGRSEINESQERAFYTNLTGVVHGEWVQYEADLVGLDKVIWPRINLSEIAPGVKWQSEKNEHWIRNITGNNGKLRLRLEEKDSDDTKLEYTKFGETSIGPIREVAATVTLHDESSKDNGWNMRIHGVHWPKTGELMMTTTSEKFAGIFGLPHLMSNLNQYVGSQKLLNRTLGMKIENLEWASRTDHGNPWSSIPGDEAVLSTPHCEYVVFAQVYPFTDESVSRTGRKDPFLIVQEIENELRYPIGAPTPKIPRLQISTVILSPDCGFILESKGPPSFAPQDGEHLLGKKHEVFVQDIQHWLEISAIVILIQTLLLKAQSKDASTPSTVGRVSLYSISIMLFADAFIFASLSLFSGSSPNLFPSALLVSFMSLMSVMLGIRFISAIWNSQEPERRERLRIQQIAEAAVQPELPEPQVDITTTDITIPGRTSITDARFSSNSPIIIPSDQDIDAEIYENTINNSPSLLPANNPNVTSTQQRTQSHSVSFATMYIRSVLLLTLILFLTLTSTSWPAWLRTTYIYSLSLLYLSFPAFQIHRNIQRNCRKALLWKFIIGQSILRLMPFAYFYLKNDNVLFAETNLKAFCVLSGWIWIQCWVLIAQSILGPRWGLPKTWYVEGWNYHPVFRNENLESGLPIGLAPTQDISSPTNTPINNPIISSFTLSEQTERRKQNVVRTIDCAICMQILEVPVIDSDRDATTSSVTSLLESRRYMVTPCRHIFHSACLEGWMRFRLQCPICRENLPPL